MLLLVQSLTVGGAEIVVYELCRYLVRKGTAVEIGCLDAVGVLGEALRAEGITVAHYQRRPGFDVLLPLRIARHARRSGAQLIHAHQFTCYVYGILAGSITGIPLIFTEHGRFHPDTSNSRRRMFNRIFAQRVARTTAVSKSVRKSLVSLERFPEGIEVIYNGVDIARFSRHVADRDEARVRIGIPPGALVIGTVGRLDPAKNHQLLIHALALLREEVSRGLFLVIVGDGPERSALTQLTAALGLDGEVRLFGERRNIDEILPAFDVFALPSLNEGTPITLLEAMAASVPIVASAVGGIPEILADGEEALLVPPGGPEFTERFAAALRTLVIDDGVRRSLQQRALARARKEFSSESIFSRYHSLYREVLGAPG